MGHGTINGTEVESAGPIPSPRRADGPAPGIGSSASFRLARKSSRPSPMINGPEPGISRFPHHPSILTHCH